MNHPVEVLLHHSLYPSRSWFIVFFLKFSTKHHSFKINCMLEKIYKFLIFYCWITWCKIYLSFSFNSNAILILLIRALHVIYSRLFSIINLQSSTVYFLASCLVETIFLPVTRSWYIVLMVRLANRLIVNSRFVFTLALNTQLDF